MKAALLKGWQVIENSVLLDVVMEWSVLTHDERVLVQGEVEQLRKKVKAHWKDEPLGPCAGIWRFSYEISQDVASKYAPGAAYAIERAILQAMFSPEALAWEQTCQHLMNAFNDPIVKRNPVAVHFVKETLSIARCSEPFTKEGELFEYMQIFGAKQAASKRASKAAKSKNIEPRAWVLIEWVGRTNKKQSKSAFALRYAERLKKEFDVSVAPNTIERSWLPKG